MPELMNVTYSYGDKTIIKDFSFDIKEGEVTAVLGASGSGKTTLLYMLSGLAKAKSGSIEPFPIGLTGFVFQEDRLLPNLTCMENLCVVGIDKETAREYLKRSGLSDYADKYPCDLSGGMSRRLAVIRGLAFGKGYFVLDEPLRALDLKTAEETSSLIKEKTEKSTALIITHSPTEAFTFAKRIVVVGKRPLEILGDFQREDFADADSFTEILKTLL